MGLLDEQCCHTECIALLVAQARVLGFRVKVHEWNRDLETQKMYVRDGKSKTLASRHLDKCATDLVLIQGARVITAGEEFRPLGLYWESLGGRWGGRFHDAAAWLKTHGRPFDPAKDLGWDSPHFETPAGRI